MPRPGHNEDDSPKDKPRFLGFGGGDSDDEEKKKKKPTKKPEGKPGAHGAGEGKPGPGGKKPHGNKPDSSDEEGPGKKPGGRPGHGKPGDKPGRDDDDDGPGKKPQGRPGQGPAGPGGKKPHGPAGGKPGHDDDDDGPAGKKPHGGPGHGPAGGKPGHDADDDGPAGKKPHGQPGHGPAGGKPHGGRPGHDDDHGPAGGKKPQGPGAHGPPGGKPHGGKPGHDGPGAHGPPGGKPHGGKPGHDGPGAHGPAGGKHDDDEGKPGQHGHGKPGQHGKPQHGKPQHGKPGGHDEHAPSHGGGGHGAGTGAAAGVAAGAAAGAGAAHAAHGGGGHGSTAEEQQKLVEQQRKEAEDQRHRDEEERKRLQKIDQQNNPPQGGHGHGGGGGGGTVVQVNEGESIQKALENAQPGTTIVLASGVYNEALKSRCDGTKDKPITIQGPTGGSPAIVKGSDKSGTCVEINHDYYILENFTIDGQIHDCKDKDDVHNAFREKCLAIRGNRNHREITAPNGDRYPSAVEGCVVRNMKINNCGGEGIRVRYFVTHTEIYHNKITSTGCFDFKFKGDKGKKNGEGIYVGTSSKQWEKNLTGEQDICRWTHIYENFIDTHGNECVDVKEGTLETIIEKNYCTGQLDEESGGIDSRADRTTIRYNKVVGCKGAGVRLGGHKVDKVQYGIHCEVYCNQLVDNEYGGVKIMTEPHTICQNDISGQGGKYKIFRGEKADKFEETCECPFDVSPPKGDLEQAEWFQKVKNM